MNRNIVKLLALLLTVCFALALPLAANAAVTGDVDGDGTVTAADARLALRAAVALEDYKKGSAQFTGADVIADGEVTAADARIILRMAVDLEPKENQYDILRSGTFYFEGSMTDVGGETTPMTLGYSKDVIFMEMSTDGMTMGYLIKSKNIYLLSPPHKIYHKLNALEKTVLKSYGLMDDAEVRAAVGEFGFEDMPALSEASRVEAASLNGESCAAYIFDMSDGGKTTVYMCGNRLLGFSSTDANGKEQSTVYFTDVRSVLPALPPKDYRSVTLLELVTKMAE